MGESLGWLQALDGLTGGSPSPGPEERGAVRGPEARTGGLGSGHEHFPPSPAIWMPSPAPRSDLCSLSQAGWISLIQSLWDCFSSKLPLFHSEGSPSNPVCPVLSPPKPHFISCAPTPSSPAPLIGPTGWEYRSLPLCGTSKRTRILAPRHCGVTPQGL